MKNVIRGYTGGRQLDFLKQISLQEKGDAEVFAHLFENKVIFDHEEGEWYIFNGHIWEQDKCKHTLNLVEQIAQTYEQATQGINYEHAPKLERFHKARISHLRKRSGINNALELAAAKLPLTEEWDNNPYLLAVKNGIIELKTGKLRAGKPDDYMRNCSDVEFKGLDEPCERWQQFLNELFPHNPEIPKFLQRLFGYAVSGLDVEHIFPVFYGEQGRNGKDILLTTICAVLGKHLAGPVSKEVLLSANKNPGATAPFLYELRDTRLAYCDETGEGAAFDEAQVKMISGGAPFKAKALYQQPVIIYPKYIVVVTTNSKPSINVDDDALWERLVVVKFTERFIEEPVYDNEHLVDKFLKEKLKKEYSGILAWLVQGFLDWQEQGLAIPESVRYVTTEYRNEQDPLSKFVETECVIGPEEKVSVTEFKNTYFKWSEATGEKKISGREIARVMKKKFPQERYTSGFFYEGISIKATIEEEMKEYLLMVKERE